MNIGEKSLIFNENIGFFSSRPLTTAVFYKENEYIKNTQPLKQQVFPNPAAKSSSLNVLLQGTVKFKSPLESRVVR